MILPCDPYSTVDAMRDCPPFDDDDEYTEDALEDALEVASRVMYLATGRQFHGTCEEAILRPCGCATCGLVQDMGWGRIAWPGSYDCGGACHGSCSCGTVHQLYLGFEPLATVTQVRIDGAVFDASKYRVDDWRWLVRTDGNAWPVCQNMAAADGATGTWDVTLTWGLPPSPAVVKGTEALAGEIAKACAGQACSLPRRSVQSITRQGVTITALDPMEFLTREPGKPYTTGVYEADLAIVFENPGGIEANASFLNPDDFGPHARRVGT